MRHGRCRGGRAGGPWPARPSHAHPDALDDLEDGCKRAERGALAAAPAAASAAPSAPERQSPVRTGPGGAQPGQNRGRAGPGVAEPGPNRAGGRRRALPPARAAHLIRRPRR